jgi:SAM-dependent methyltransferase
VSETFDAAWLELREDLDHRSRATGVLAPLQGWWTARGATAVLDLGCGTGSNLRYLAPRLPGPQQWTLVDHDADLLTRIRAPNREVGVRPVRGDVATEGLAAVQGAHLVTASALLDLVSEAWLVALVDACATAGCAGLFALTYDGGIEWSGGGEPLDAIVRDSVNAHQRRDKGLGSALGPTAAALAERLFRERGYRTWLLPSPWRIGPRDAAVASALVSGWAAAAAEQRPDQSGAMRAWVGRRTATVARGDFGLVVGHLDLLALPADSGHERS